MLTRRIIGSYRQKRSLRRRMAEWDKRVIRFAQENKVEPISDEEFTPIREYWKKYLPVPIQSYFYSAIKASQAYNVDVDTYPVDFHYISESIMYPYIMRKLNPKDYACVYANKGIYGTLFGDVRRPYEFIRICNGIVLDNDNNFQTLEKGISSVLDYNGPIIIKPGANSHGGAGVQLMKEVDKDRLQTVILSYGADCIVQKVIEQSEETARFNGTSLNTFRITTLLLNGQVSVLARMMRCGLKGAIVDNASSGGMCIGVSDAGILTRGANFHHINYNQTDTGIKIRGERINGFHEVCEFAKELHARIPYCAMVGWDIALDKSAMPVLLESNVMTPGIWVHEMLQGPIFGDRFDEVMDFVFPR